MKICWTHFDDMEMTPCIISLCLNTEWSFKCKCRIKSVWGFLTSAQQWYLAGFYPPLTISCCLHELDLFRQYEPLYLIPVKAVWTWARGDARECDTESVFLSAFCVMLFGQNIKTQQNNKTASSACIISHTGRHRLHLLTTPQHPQMQQIMHPSFMLGWTKLWHPFVNCS